MPPFRPATARAMDHRASTWNDQHQIPLVRRRNREVAAHIIQLQNQKLAEL